MTGERYVHVRCTIRDGAFSTEYLVIIQAKEQSHVGFVPREYVDKVDDRDDHSAVIEGRVVDSGDDETVTVQFPGAFVQNTRGILSFPGDWAERNIFPAQLAEQTA